jgi:CRISPR-associated protein Cmr4
MYKLAKPIFFHAITPTHVGSGSDLGIVDLPIQRERHTGFPKIEGSSLKGSIRESFEEKLNNVQDRIDLNLAFGLDDSNESGAVKKFFEENNHTEFAGALGFTDARLLFFPVKSMKGVFVWITCPKVLKRFRDDLNLCKPRISNEKLRFYKSNINKAICSSDKIQINGNLILEEYTFDTESEDAEDVKKFIEFAAEMSNVLGIQELKDKSVMLPDDDFSEFVQLSTEVITRTKINNETGTVAKGALFTEEYLPSETILYALTLASPLFIPEKIKDKLIEGSFAKNTDEAAVMELFERNLPSVMQIGANATLGKGIVTTKILNSITVSGYQDAVQLEEVQNA